MSLIREKKFLLFELSTNDRSFNGIFLIILFYLGSLCFAAVVAPLVYSIIQWWADYYPNTLNTYLVHKDFHDYVDRLRWIPIVIGLPWFLKMCGLRFWKNLGMAFNKKSAQYLYQGFIAGAAVVGLIVITQYLTGAIAFQSSLSLAVLLPFFCKALFIAFIVSLLEECIFRGIILRAFYTAMRPLFAVILSAVFFAYTHFKMSDAVWHATDQVITWKSGFFVGFWMLAEVVRNFEWIHFLNFTFLGIILGLLFLKTHSLVPSISFHAGALALKSMHGSFFFLRQGGGGPWLGSQKIIDSLLSLTLLTIIAIVLYLLYYNPPSASYGNTIYEP